MNYRLEIPTLIEKKKTILTPGVYLAWAPSKELTQIGVEIHKS